jgi:soluble lytic murein transglycosylase-like protein
MTVSQPQNRSMRRIPGLLLIALAFAPLAAIVTGTAVAADNTSANATAEMLVISSTATEPDRDLLDKLATTLAANHVQTDRFDAQVWLMASESRLGRYMDEKAERLALLQLVYREAHRAQLDPDLVLAVMQVESHFDRYAISRVGAQGLMQIMPFWRNELGRPMDNLMDVETNVIYGTTILAHYLDVSKGDLVEALGRYNGSKGRLRYPEKVISAWRKQWRHKSSSELPELLTSCANYGLKACRYR